MHAAEPPVGGAAEALPTRVSAADTGNPDRALSRIRKRHDFLAANSGARVVTPAFILLVKPAASLETRTGFTVSRKVGNAVARNRAKRRLREVARLVLPAAAVANADHVFIARAQSAESGFGSLLADARTAMAKARRKLGATA